MPNTAGKDPNPQPGGVRLGGVRADFVAALGKRLSELRLHWDALVDAPGSPALRNEFRRHVHALSTRARVLRFEAMAARLEKAERRLERAAAAGGIDADDVDDFDALFRELPALAWAEVGGEVPESDADSGVAPGPAAPPSPATPVSVFVIGRPPLANTLNHDGAAGDGLALEVEVSDRLDNALELTRALAPDVVVLDGDMPGAPIVSETLARDTITESTPVIVVGSFSHADQASDFLAHGVVRALPKPVSPQKLRNAVRTALESQDRYDPAPDIGEVSVEELAETLARQVRDGLADALRPEARGVTVNLGSGTEVLAAVWGAVARVREMLTIRSQGAIRFHNTGPVGAVPVAPWLDVKATDQARREGGRETEQDAKLSLEGRRVLVVDDDPAITWFLSGLFRSHGCAVKEAHDGQRGLELAFRFDPDLVVTDILMPKLDGFGLCRALKRDIMLRDVPVVVLSWKEDLLQRVRELGVGADGYLRKEATSSAIVRTVHESLRPRSRIEDRLRQGGEVRGRLDGLTARTLLDMTASTMPDARVSVRDASHLYEVQLRDGKICDATRTALDGETVRGDEALVSLVRVFTGRFQVVPESGPAAAPSERTLREIVAPAVAEARAAQALLEGAGLSRASRIELRLPRLDLDTLPEPAAATYRAIAMGRSPASLVEQGTVTAASLEQLLSDAATRGAVEAVLDDEGHDLLTPALEAPLHAWTHPLGRGPASTRQPLAQPEPTSDRSPSTEPETAEEEPSPSEEVEPTPSPHESVEETVAGGADAAGAPLDLSEITDEPPDETESSDDDEVFSAPTSLEEAVIREVADATGSEIPPSGTSRSMLDASELRPRSTRRPEGMSLPSLPPDAIVPGTESLVPDQAGLDEPAEPAVPDVPSMPPPPDVSTLSVDRLEAGEEEEARDEASDGPPPEEDDDGSEGDEEDEGDEDEADGVDTEAEATEHDIPKRSFVMPLVGALAVGAALVAAAVYLSPPEGPLNVAPDSSSPSEPTAPGPAIPAPPADTGDTATEADDHLGASEEEAAGRVETGLPIEDTGEVPPDQGLLEVRTGRPDAAVSIDGRDLGQGQTIRMFLNPGEHRVMVVWRGKQLRGRVDVSQGKRTRLSLEDAWEP